MTMVVGIAPDGRGRAALHLAGMLARSADDDLVLCAVVPAPWPPSPARVDAEYRAHLERTANEALDEARARLPADISATTLVHHARSAPAGLLELAEQHDATVIVVGSSSAGAFGRVALGSVTDGLIHSSPIPVALSSRGYRCKPVARVMRVRRRTVGPRAGTTSSSRQRALRHGSVPRCASPPSPSGRDRRTRPASGVRPRKP
jgi:nucleotide-binding universal stress UspA family protein